MLNSHFYYNTILTLMFYFNTSLFFLLIIGFKNVLKSVKLFHLNKLSRLLLCCFFALDKKSPSCECVYFCWPHTKKGRFFLAIICYVQYTVQCTITFCISPQPSLQHNIIKIIEVITQNVSKNGPFDKQKVTRNVSNAFLWIQTK